MGREDPTRSRSPTPRGREGPFAIAVLHGDAIEWHVLPSRGAITFGRSSSCDVSCDDASISRRHARVHVDGPAVTVEDLGSRNRTRVRGVPILASVPVHVQPGDVIECGVALLILRRGPPPSAAQGNPFAASAGAVTLIVGPEARWFEVGDRERIQLGRRGALRLVLDALTDRRLAAGAGASVDELFAIGWPGERARADSAAARVYTTVQRLRTLGLDGILVTRDDGYVLSPDVVVRRVD